MDSDELLRIQVRLEMSHCFPHEMRPPTDVETYVAAGRLTPVDVGGRDEIHPATRLHHQAIPRWRLAPAHLGQQGHQLTSKSRGLALRELIARACESASLNRCVLNGFSR